MSDRAHRVKRVALVPKYLLRNGYPWLTDDLISEFLEQGFSVDVYYPREQTDELLNRYQTESCRIHFLGATNQGSKLGRVFKQLRATARLGVMLRRSPPDLLVSFSFFAYFFPATFLANRRKSTRSVGILWDFYPIQWQESGLLSSRAIAWLIKKLERLEISSLDHVLLMTEDNLSYLESYIGPTPSDKDVVGLWRTYDPAWVGTATAESIGLDPTQQYFLFGGSLVAGREVERLIDAFALLYGSHPDVTLLIVGSGPEGERILNYASEVQARVHIQGALPLGEYLSLARHCTAGIVVTSERVTSPSFPSKALDYMYAGLPVIACVQPDSDFGKIVEDSAACGLTPGLSVENIAKSIATLAEDPALVESFGNRSSRYLELECATNKAVELIVSQ